MALVVGAQRHVASALFPLSTYFLTLKHTDLHPGIQPAHFVSGETEHRPPNLGKEQQLHPDCFAYTLTETPYITSEKRILQSSLTICRSVSCPKGMPLVLCKLWG